MLEIEVKFHDAMDQKDYVVAKELSNELQKQDQILLQDHTKSRMYLLDFIFEHGDANLNPKPSLHHRAIVNIGLSIRYKLKDQSDIEQLDIFIKNAIQEVLNDVKRFSIPPINLVLFESACQLLASISMDIEKVTDYSHDFNALRSELPTRILDLLEEVRSFPFDIQRTQAGFNHRLGELSALFKEALRYGINPSDVQPQVTTAAWQRLIDRLEQISDQNEQLRYEFENRIQAELSAMQQAFHERLQAELEQIHQPLNRHVSKTETVEIEIAMVKDTQQTIQDKLNTIQHTLKRSDQESLKDQADITALRGEVAKVNTRLEDVVESVERINEHINNQINRDIVELQNAVVASPTNVNFVTLEVVQQHIDQLNEKIDELQETTNQALRQSLEAILAENQNALALLQANINRLESSTFYRNELEKIKAVSQPTERFKLLGGFLYDTPEVIWKDLHDEWLQSLDETAPRIPPNYQIATEKGNRKALSIMEDWKKTAEEKRHTTAT